jgi:HSP20 family protein
MNNFLPSRLSRYFDDLRDDVNFALDRALQRVPGTAPVPNKGRRRGGNRDEEGFPWDPFSSSASGSPVLDVEEFDDNVVITAELPGLAKEDFTVEVVNNRLRLSGEKREDREEKRGDAYLTERSYGRFSRSVDLPCEVEATKAKAELKNGLLKITLPKAQSAKGKTTHIEVK